MIVKNTNIEDCKHIFPDVFYDFRGEYVETYNKEAYDKLFPKDVCPEFVQDDFSISTKYTLRGFHGDPLTWKLVQAKVGIIILWVIDIRQESTTYGWNHGFLLNERNREQVLVPNNCAIAHLCLSDVCMFDYKQTQYYDRHAQFSYNYKSNGVEWQTPDDKLILSNRDRNAPLWIRNQHAPI
jgi:dTDP-4-dehydrorhamnose 3,5-epimerase